MKHLLLFCCTTLLILSSCSSEDDGPKDTTGPLVGTWIGTAVNAEGTAEAEFQGELFEFNVTGTGYDIDNTMIFTEDPNMVTIDGSYSLEIVGSIFGQSRTENVENIELLESGTWSRSGDIVTVGAASEGNTFEITELTDQNLTIKVSTIQDISQTGLGTTADVDVIFKFRKQ